MLRETLTSNTLFCNFSNLFRACMWLTPVLCLSVSIIVFMTNNCIPTSFMPFYWYVFNLCFFVFFLSEAEERLLRIKLYCPNLSTMPASCQQLSWRWLDFFRLHMNAAQASRRGAAAATLAPLNDTPLITAPLIDWFVRLPARRAIMPPLSSG